MSNPTYDDLVRQITVMSAELAKLKEHPTVSMASSVKLPLPPPFKGACDGDSVKNFLDSLDNWFEMVSMTNDT